MALTQASLATKIQTEIIAQFGAPDDAGILQKFADAIAKAVVDEIQANAEVTASGPDPQGGTQNVTGTVS